MLQALGDEDSEWLPEVAAKGVRLGVDMSMARIPKLFEPKEKWNLDFTEEDFVDTMASNYKSAEENAAGIERQVTEEVLQRSILMWDRRKAEECYEGRLAVARPWARYPRS